MKGIDIKLLRAFVTLAMKGSYSNAAKALFLTQPALSKQIQTLEHLTGGDLFLRGRHGASLTVFGQQLFSKANELLQSHIEFLNYARDINSKNREKLFMGFGISTFQQVPKWIKQFHQQVPECEIVINHLPSSVQMKMLLEGRLHIGFVRMPVSKGLASYILYEETLALAMPKNSDLNKMNIQAALSAYPLLQLDPSTNPCLAEQTAHYLQSNQLKAVPVSATDDMTSLLALIAGGNGVAFLPASVRTFLPANVNLLMPVERQIRWDIGVVWNPKIKSHRRDEFLRLVVAGDTPVVA
ncbi:LysR family transcriptional regulator [Citrobacter freundii]|uniref:LysR family transcriptional regulator n=1 Tax=Citrobacter europaeus TaxID=1914243 RepID=UPI00094782A0|nr:LysR family transcriptional regulator [Citrobacter freundii]